MPLITFEGSEGCGKSTQVRRLVTRLAKLGLPTSVLREPGDTAIGEAMRHLLQHSEENRELKPETELLLFEVSRSQLVREEIQPSLARRDVTVCDRFFDSTTVYQGAARALDSAALKTLNDFAIANCIPDLTVLLDIDRSTARTRLGNRQVRDRMDEQSEEFHNGVTAAYRDLARPEPKPVVLIDEHASPDAVEIEVWKLVSARFRRVADHDSGSTIIHGLSGK